MTEFVSPHLRTVLKSYQDTATKSLHGPATLSLVVQQHSNNSGSSSNGSPSGSDKNRDTNSDSGGSSGWLQLPPPPPEMPQPILTEPDTNGCSTLSHTVLEGRPISCFMLGGELRLCLPQVLNNVLMNFSLDQINSTCETLQIFCSQCTPEQLNEFKAAKILPEDVKSSGLITLTNAERLCAALLVRGVKQPPAAIKTAEMSFRVAHRCFGGADGVCWPQLFSITEPVCIECCECGEWFAPQKFIFHGHGPQEEQTCHWGFDSNNWRAYIHPAEDYYLVAMRAEDVPEDKQRAVQKLEKFIALLDDMREREKQDMLSFIEDHRRDLMRKVGENRVINAVGHEWKRQMEKDWNWSHFRDTDTWQRDLSLCG